MRARRDATTDRPHSDRHAGGIRATWPAPRTPNRRKLVPLKRCQANQPAATPLFQIQRHQATHQSLTCHYGKVLAAVCKADNQKKQPVRDRQSSVECLNAVRTATNSATKRANACSRELCIWAAVRRFRGVPAAACCWNSRCQVSEKNMGGCAVPGLSSMQWQHVSYQQALLSEDMTERLSLASLLGSAWYAEYHNQNKWREGTAGIL